MPVSYTRDSRFEYSNSFFLNNIVFVTEFNENIYSNRNSSFQTHLSCMTTYVHGRMKTKDDAHLLTNYLGFATSLYLVM